MVVVWLLGERPADPETRVCDSFFNICKREICHAAYRNTML